VGLVREALQEYGVEGELLVIQDGEKAIRFVQALDAPADGPELIILDLNLPKRPGREVLKAMRQSAKYQEAKIVILSSSDAPEERSEAIVLGASLYLRKPSRLAEFLNLGAVFKAILEVGHEKGPVN
jgi:two-component system, chemotaxis family, response regulator Rcp1